MKRQRGAVVRNVPTFPNKNPLDLAPCTPPSAQIAQDFLMAVGGPPMQAVGDLHSAAGRLTASPRRTSRPGSMLLQQTAPRAALKTRFVDPAGSSGLVCPGGGLVLRKQADLAPHPAAGSSRSPRRSRHPGGVQQQRPRPQGRNEDRYIESVAASSLGAREVDSCSR